MLPTTYVMLWLDRLKPLEWTTLYKFIQKSFKHAKCSWPFDSLFFKPLLSRLFSLLFVVAIRRLGGGKLAWNNLWTRQFNHCSFHMASPCDTCIFYHYETHLIFQNSTKTRFAINFLMIEWLLKVKPIVEQTVIDPKWTTLLTCCITPNDTSPSPRWDMFEPT
jgi:hypothetical protein